MKEFLSSQLNNFSGIIDFFNSFPKSYNNTEILKLKTKGDIYNYFFSESFHFH